MTLEELNKLKQENYPLFIETVKSLNEETPKYSTISRFSLKCYESQNDPEVRENMSRSIKKSLQNPEIRKKISEQAKKPELKEIRAKAGKAKSNMKYAIYNDVAYTRTELIQMLGVSKTVLWDIKRGYTKNRFNLKFL